MLKWPDLPTVRKALAEWAAKALQARDDILRIGYFGSYARGDWGVGSDLDLVIVIETSTEPFEARAAQWDTTTLPVPTDVLVYTQSEWESLPRGGRFRKMMMREAEWLHLQES